MTLANFVVRATEITGAYGNYGTKPERVSKETVAMGHCELVNHELELFIHFVYKRADSGRLLNVQASGQIPSGVWTPWGSSGKSQLTRYERDTTRRYLVSLNTGRPPRPLFFYQEATRHWYIDFKRHNGLEDALTWLKQYHLTVNIWLEFSLW